MRAGSQGASERGLFWLWVHVHEVKQFSNQGILHVDYLGRQRKQKNHKAEVISGADARPQPDAVVVKTDDAEFTIIAMATSRWRPENVADVAVSHLFEYGLPGVLDHVKYFPVIDVQKVIAHSYGLEYTILKVNRVTGIATKVSGRYVFIYRGWNDARLAKRCPYQVDVGQEPKENLHAKLQILAPFNSSVDVMIEMEIVCIEPQNNNRNNIDKETGSKHIQRLGANESSAPKHQRWISNFHVVIEHFG